VRPDVTLEIVDDHDHPVPLNTIGRIRTKGVGMLDNYLDSDNSDNSYFKEGFHYPGDLGFLSDDGALSIVGRIDDVLHIGGSKIQPSIITKGFENVFGGCEYVVVEWENPSLGVTELALAFNGQPLEKISNLETKISQSFSGVVNLFENVAFPLNQAGKIDLKLVRQASTRASRHFV